MELSRGAVAVVAAMSAFGCGGHPASSPATRTTPTATATASASVSVLVESTSTAEGTVVAYYSRLGRHDMAGAAQLLEPHMRRQYLTAGPDGEFMNTVSVSNIRDLEVTIAPSTPGLPVGYRDITQVFLTYDVVYRHIVAAGNGPNSRFVYVGRNAEGQWRILEIGTGP